VIVTYLRLLALPIDQNFDYDYPVFRSFSDPQVLSSFLLLLSIALLALYLLRRSRTGERDAAVVAFGIFWFFITLSVESSIVPIPMLINEYSRRSGRFWRSARGRSSCWKRCGAGEHEASPG
jgi:hypothetical protein